MKSLSLIAVVIAIAIGGGGLGAAAEEPHRRFDFWLGAWDVVAYGRTFGSEEPLEERGRMIAEVRPLLGGRAIVEYTRLVAGSGPPYGYSVRAYDPDERRWNALLIWPAHDAPAPYSMSGAFRGQRAEFFRRLESPRFENPLLVRFSFTDIRDDWVRWQADVASPEWGAVNFDTHEAGTWFNDGVFEMSRRGPLQSTADNATAGTQQGRWCSGKSFEMLDRLRGSWVGTTGSGEAVRAGLRSILGGCAVEEAMSIGADFESYAVSAWVPRQESWERYSIERASPTIELARSSPSREGAMFTASDSDRGRRRLTLVFEDGEAPFRLDVPVRHLPGGDVEVELRRWPSED